MSTETKKSLVPKLRFPEFRGTEGWQTEPMGNVYSFKGNNSLSRDKLNYAAGSVKNIHYGDIHTKFASHFDITQELVPFINVSELGVVREDNFCEEGDMVFADASEDMADIGKSVEIVRLNGQRLVSGLHTILARPKDERIALGFSGHLFKSGWIRTQIQKEAQGAKVLGISATRLRSLRLSLPKDRVEQQKIADCLSSLDELIAAQARKVEALKTHKKGLMQQLFPREGETQPRLRFPEFHDAEQWGGSSFGAAATFLNGRAYAQEELLEIGKYRVLRVGNFFSNKFWYYSNLELEDSKYCDDGDLLYAWSASFGPRIWSGEKVVYHYHIWKVIPSNCVDKNFLFILLDYETEKMKSQSANGLGLMHITKGAIESWKCSIPKPPEQKRIADCLISLDNFITAANQELDTLNTHKKGLMQQLFPSSEAVEA